MHVKLAIYFNYNFRNFKGKEKEKTWMIRVEDKKKLNTSIVLISKFICRSLEQQQLMSVVSINTYQGEAVTVRPYLAMPASEHTITT